MNGIYLQALANGNTPYSTIARQMLSQQKRSAQQHGVKQPTRRPSLKEQFTEIVAPASSQTKAADAEKAAHDLIAGRLSRRVKLYDKKEISNSATVTWWARGSKEVRHLYRTLREVHVDSEKLKGADPENYAEVTKTLRGALTSDYEGTKNKWQAINRTNGFFYRDLKEGSGSVFVRIYNSMSTKDKGEWWKRLFYSEQVSEKGNQELRNLYDKLFGKRNWKDKGKFPPRLESKPTGRRGGEPFRFGHSSYTAGGGTNFPPIGRAVIRKPQMRSHGHSGSAPHSPHTSSSRTRHVDPEYLALDTPPEQPLFPFKTRPLSLEPGRYRDHLSLPPGTVARQHRLSAGLSPLSFPPTQSPLRLPSGTMPLGMFGRPTGQLHRSSYSYPVTFRPSADAGAGVPRLTTPSVRPMVIPKFGRNPAALVLGLGAAAVVAINGASRSRSSSVGSLGTN
jgi:hypothetical protein